MKNFRFSRFEFTGALGDLGTLLPLSVALVAVNGLEPVRTFMFVGFFYIITGLLYKIPIPVQPLKAAAVIAISLHLPREAIFASAILMGVIVLLSAVTGCIKRFSGIFSIPVVRGIQITIGLLLTLEGLKFLLSPALMQDWRLASLIPGGAVNVQGSRFVLPGLSDFTTAFFLLVIPQLPVTFGNAIFASSELAQKYYGKKAENATPKALATTIGIFNIAAGFAGAMPVCHGSGGVAAHYRFGARTGAAPVIMGSALLVFCLVFRSSAAGILALVPLPVLGILLTASGIGMIRLIFELGKSWREKLVTASIAVITLLTHSLTAGLCAGLVANLAVHRTRAS